MTALTFLLVTLSAPALAGDKDGDGVDNKTDACKLEPEDADGFEDEDGCPDPDNDGDGMLDAVDKCPNDAEDKDGFEDGDGCPELDNDGDGVEDADDQCPQESEADDVKDGCPAVTYDLLNTDGWVPALKKLNEGLGAALAKGGKGCDDAAKAGTDWLDEHDAKKLHGVFEARAARAPQGVVDPNITRKVVEAQAAVWPSTSKAFEIYCKDHGTWPGLSKKLDEVYGMAKKKE